MKLVSVSTGAIAPLDYNGNSLLSAIRKSPRLGPVAVTVNQLVGDEKADLRTHGGPHKAVHALSAAAYQWWGDERGETPPGFLGENLLIDTFDENEICLGDVFSVGTVQLQVTQPRFPCLKLIANLNDPDAAKKMIRSQMPGIYFRVLQPGLIEAGQSIAIIDREQVRVPVLALFTAYLSKSRIPNPDFLSDLRRVKSLTEEWRLEWEP